MFDIGFWELLIIAVVLLLVLGPERLPEVAKQAAFFVRKARQGMYRIRNEMRSELGDDPFQGLQDARREVSNFKNDMKQFGRDLADSHESTANSNKANKTKEMADALSESEALSESVSALGVEAIASDSKPGKNNASSKKNVTKSTKKKTTKKKAVKKKTAKKKVSKKVAEKNTGQE